jgi:hypothetical protein
MLKKFLPLYTFSLLFIFSCNADTSIKTKARIFERKILQDGKLMICYAFTNNGSLIKDSTVIDNLAIPEDSIAIVFQKNNPSNSDILLNRVTNQKN